jgi:hypothetical protein
MNPQCEPPQFGLHVDSPVLIMDSNRNKILSPGSVSIPSIDLSFCAALANGCRRLAGQCSEADSLALSSRPMEEYEHSCTSASCNAWMPHFKNIISPEPRIQSATTFSIDRIERQSPPRTLEPDLNCFAATTNYIEMTFFSSLDDMRTIRMKVDQKAHDLFKEKTGQAPLTVTRILNPQETNATPFEKDRKVLNLSDIKRLRNVRSLPYCVAAF